MTSTGLVPVSFTLQLKPEFVEEYRRLHSPVWPDMLRAIRDSGWSNYSIFLRPDGLLVGYFETDDPDTARARMASFEVSERWAAQSDHLFLVEQEWLEPVFNLEEQLQGLDAST